ncbi:hypothetical protein CABS03_04042 [Colletotrichum abscissum]|uniref:Uncharacterized protein n=1 Tax=Colletotrichum abscissum TaxID=1671311 RepID=A0A9P9XBF5_9PEZI|nr:hypothetical protein CABS02_09437 [Colletotrichum abscissum]
MDGQDVGDLRVEIFSFGLALVGNVFSPPSSVLSSPSLGGGLVVFVSSLLVLGEPLAFLEGAHRRRPPNCVPKSQLLGGPTFTAHVDVARQSSSATALMLVVGGKARA